MPTITNFDRHKTVFLLQQGALSQNLAQSQHGLQSRTSGGQKKWKVWKPIYSRWTVSKSHDLKKQKKTIQQRPDTWPESCIWPFSWSVFCWSERHRKRSQWKGRCQEVILKRYRETSQWHAELHKNWTKNQRKQVLEVKLSSICTEEVMREVHQWVSAAICITFEPVVLGSYQIYWNHKERNVTFQSTVQYRKASDW